MDAVRQYANGVGIRRDSLLIEFGSDEDRREEKMRNGRSDVMGSLEYRGCAGNEGTEQRRRCK